MRVETTKTLLERVMTGHFETITKNVVFIVYIYYNSYLLTFLYFSDPKNLEHEYIVTIISK